MVDMHFSPLVNSVITSVMDDNRNVAYTCDVEHWLPSSVSWSCEACVFVL